MKFLHCFVLVALAVSTADAARRVDAKEQLDRSLARLGGSSHRAKREARRLSVRDLMGAGPETDLQVKETGQTVQGTKLWKMEEMFRGKEVFSAQVTIETDPSGTEILDASGSFLQDIEKDTDGTASVYSTEAVINVLEVFGDRREEVRDIKLDLKIFTDKSGQAFPGYLVEYKMEEGDEPRRPTAIVDGRDGRVVMSWNSMTTACPDRGQGTGGNDKIGMINYNGIDYDCLNVTKEGDVCLLENDNVRVINMGGVKWYNITDTMQYDCVNATDGINGAYSPALDAFHIGTSAYKMFSEWYNMRPVKEDRLTMRVHYGTDYPNAFWNGVNTTFGDGRGSFRPFVTIDLVGHEIGHALVEQNSGLIWYQQPGAINEAFADITGEVLEHYMMSGHDWLVGAGIVPEEGAAVRYFIEPEQNWMSISSMEDWIDYMQPHMTGSILAHAFYRIVALHGQGMRQAYHVFLHANQMYWNHMSSIEGGACDLMKSAYDLGQPGNVYQQAFEHVGITVCDISNHVIGLRKNETYDNIQVSNTTRPVFTFGVPGEWTQLVFVEATSSYGDVHISITDQTWMEAYDPSELDILAEGCSYAVFNQTDRDMIRYYVTVTLSSDSPELWDDVIVQAGFTCMGANQTSHGYFERLRKENCEGRSY